MRICVITSGHLATCPRMVKAADALSEAGHEVRLVSTQFVDWAAAADETMGAGRRWSAIDYRRATAPAVYWKTRLRFHVARQWIRVAGPGRASLATLAAAQGRASHDLLKLALAEPADLYYGGTCGGLAIAALAARRSGKRYALDLEDFHDAEFPDKPASHYLRVALRRLQRNILPGAAFITAGSAAIAARYRQTYCVRAIPVHNTFSLPAQAPDPEPANAGALRLYWFSQTIGAGRGLEEVAQAVDAAGIRAELHLRGCASPEYIADLRSLACGSLTIQIHPPAAPSRMVELSRPYDAGLSPEQGHDINRELCLSNKALTYILAGLPVVLTDTLGQRSFGDDLGEGAVRYKCGDIAALAEGLRGWAGDRTRLRRARQAAWQAATLRWHWEHRCEKGALLDAVRGVTQ